MKKMLAAAVLVMTWTIDGPSVISAHHSIAVNFDQSKSVSVTGTIKELDMRNPHSQITLEVTDSGGRAVDWFIEWNDVNSLIRRSVPYDRLRVGDSVTITASPSRRLPNVGFFREAVLPDGKILRDCGFGAFRQSVAKGSTEIECGDRR